jgi:hypothetical protein
MFKNKKITIIALALLLAVCLTGGTAAALTAGTNNNKGNGEIALDESGNPAAPGGRGSRLEIDANPSVAAQGEKGNGEIDTEEDAELTAAKHNGEIALDESGNPAAPGGRGSRLR